MFKLTADFLNAITKKISTVVVTESSRSVTLSQCGCQGYCGSGCSGKYCANGCDDGCSAQVYRGK